MSTLLYPCTPDPQAALLHAVVCGDAATARRILQTGVVPDAQALSPSSHLLVAAGVLPDLLSAGLSPRGLSPLAQDVWVVNAVMSDPMSVPPLLQRGWRMSQDTKHTLESFAATRGEPWASAASQMPLPFGFSLTARSSRLAEDASGASRRVGATGARWWEQDND
jgi:hypothetical protein